MQHCDAITWLERTVSASTLPVLDTSDLIWVLSQAQVVDEAGRAPTDPGWTPTWDLAYAAADAYELKAERLVATATPSLKSFTSEGSSFTRDGGVTADQLLALAARWRGRSTVATTNVVMIEVEPDSTGTWPRSAVDMDTSHAD